MPHKPGLGAIFGIVSENGVAKEASPVYLYDMQRDSGVAKAKLLTKQLTRSDGGFTFSGLDPNYQDYSVVATDEDGAEPKNALIQDRVQPVGATAGIGAVGDWYTRAYKDGAVAGVVPWPVAESGPLRPMGMVGSTIYVAPVAEPNVVMGVPEIPAMAGMRLQQGGRIGSYGRIGVPNNSDSSLEFVVELDDFSGTAPVLEFMFPKLAIDNQYGGVYLDTLNNPTFSGYTVRALYSFANKTLQFYLQTGGQNTSNFTNLGTVSLAAYSGKAHIIVSYVVGIALKVYVNGGLAGTLTPATVVNWMPANTISGAVRVAWASGSSCECTLGPVVAYVGALTEAQVEAHYKALFGNTNIPLATGYARAMCAELPMWYYRMNELDPSQGFSSELHKRDEVSSLTPPYSLIKADNNLLLTSGMSSPIVGGSTVEKTAGAILSGNYAGLCGLPFSNQFSFTCWVYFNNPTPAAEETIARFSVFVPRGTSPINPNGFFALSRGTNGKLSAMVHTAAGAQTFAFDYSPPSGSWVNLWFVVDKTGTDKTASLYAGSTSTQPALVGAGVANSSPLYTLALHGSNIFLANSGVPGVHIGTNLSGRICEVAVLPMALTLDRIVDVWAAKDVP